MRKLSRSVLNLFVCGLFALSVLITSRAQSREWGIQTQQVEDLIREFKLDAEQEQQLRASVQEFNRDPYVRVADGSTDRIYMKYFCVGGQASVAVVGLKGLKCINPAGEFIQVGFTGSRYETILTGLVAEKYMGVTLGLSLITGVLVISCPLNECAKFEGEWGRVANGVSGGGAYGLTGGMLGYFAKGNSTVVIAAYQAGLAVDAGISSVLIWGSKSKP